LGEGSQRQLRTIETAAYRGTIFDRAGNPLAISTPVDSVWVNPKIILQDTPGLKKLTRSLGLNFRQTFNRLKQRVNREFVFIKRRIKPELAQQAVADVKGAYLQREYNRFYPAGEVVAHVVGFTDIDNKGREGLELVYQDSLKARPGKRKILRNRKGEVVEEIAQVVAAEPGQDLTTSIDMRLQYIAYRSLASTIKQYHAKSGSAVLLDAPGNIVPGTDQANGRHQFVRHRCQQFFGVGTAAGVVDQLAKTGLADHLGVTRGGQVTHDGAQQLRLP